MADSMTCEHCGAPLAPRTGNVIPLRRPKAAAPPQTELIDVGDGRVRLRLNLVVSREMAEQVVRLLGAID